MRSRVLRDRLRHRVIVTMKSGQAFDGLLHSFDNHAWVLRDSTAMGAGEKGSNLPVDGEILLLVGEIAYIQRP